MMMVNKTDKEPCAFQGQETTKKYRTRQMGTNAMEKNIAEQSRECPQ